MTKTPRDESRTGEPKRYKTAGLGELPECSHWGGPVVVLESEHLAYRSRAEAEIERLGTRLGEMMTHAADLHRERTALLLRVELATELLQEAYDYGTLWRGERIYQFVKTDLDVATANAKGNKGSE